LLSHTSSLNTNNQAQYYWMNFSGDPPFEFFPEPYLREFLLPGGAYYDSTVWSDKYQPGEHAMYANIGFDLISYLIELLSGESFLDYCDTHIFAPLEMTNTSFNLSRLDINQVAIPYQRYFGIYRLAVPEKYWRPRFYPAGGLYSTVEDLSHFLIAHMNQGLYKDVRLLQPDTVALMHTIAPDNAIGYGLAWMQTNIGSRLTTTGHAGDLPGADTWMLYNETQNLGAIYFANGNAAYSLIPLRGFILVQLLLYLLFTKEMTRPLTTQMEKPVIQFFDTSVLVPQPLLN
jgi:CubicO group peptidase (beta-lactamase class C family)